MARARSLCGWMSWLMLISCRDWNLSPARGRKRGNERGNWLRLVGSGLHALEEGRREVALPGVRQHREQDAPRSRPRRDLARGGEGPARGDAAEDSLGPPELACRRDRQIVADGHELVEHRWIEHGRDEVRGPALNLVRLPVAAAEQRGTGGLARDDLRLGARAFDDLA